MSPIIFFEADAGLFTGKDHSYTNQTPGAFILYMKGGLHMPLYYDSDPLIFLTPTFRKSRRIHVHSGRCLYSIYSFATERSTVGYRELNTLTDYPVPVDKLTRVV